MLAAGSTTSIRKALIRTVMLITTLCLILSISVSTYLDIEKQRSFALEKLVTYADIIAFNAQVSLLFNDRETEQKRLEGFRAATVIENIHIYKIDEFTDEITFFTSFSATNIPPIPTRENKLVGATKPVFIENHIDIVRPIAFEGIIQGYVYIRGGMTALNDYIREKLIINVVVALSVLTLVFLITLRIQRRFTQPIEALSKLVQDVSRNKNYDVRAPYAEISELNQLGNNLNILFSRTQNQLERQRKDELEIRQLNQNLEEKVNHRTIALKEANQELLNTLERMHQYQNKIVENEKMASLGQMVAGVAHEVNTPIGLGVTSSTLLRDKLFEVQTAFKNKTLTASQMERFINDGIENLDLIYRNLNRAANLVSSFKQVAVNQDTELSTKVNIPELFNNVLLTMKTELSATAHKVNIDCPSHLIIQSKAGPLQLILQNLISNSLIHGLSPESPGNIKIEVKQNKKGVRIDYFDDGKGMPSFIRKKIFDPFVTTRRGEGGSGLGMHLVYNLVTQALNGSIVLVDEHEKGVHFIIELPLDEGR
ncbi:sensor histidine kinase [Pseudoalteromonas tunicata]|uniref:histidine kinase n=1 Tax=Pseudoalteromonas tunicata D2 TaxID=87626 RepID=A4CCK5_9GAMM|nr:HAMP domain-containing sensor histidine kinase [Pseudoalteromonas tunicata]ATC93799.1 hypothetical protein PTUN_a1116 [Pseudoalteromonas tunicata]AXT29619.1 sensor histidine kinase [Pseudoalteromonas tunicata]EAR27298.1 Signal transduction histidine kinase (contains HAMP domain) [Pseudoalteromonas tunicata D2]MDP4985631.1 HAMP domain-containing histidine kinase [Pseudoalteromonas tunicata]